MKKNLILAITTFVLSLTIAVVATFSWIILYDAHTSQTNAEVTDFSIEAKLYSYNEEEDTYNLVGTEITFDELVPGQEQRFYIDITNNTDLSGIFSIHFPVLTIDSTEYDIRTVFYTKTIDMTDPANPVYSAEHMMSDTPFTSSQTKIGEIAVTSGGTARFYFVVGFDEEANDNFQALSLIAERVEVRQ